MKESMKRKKGKAAETRKKILNAARMVFSNHPYHVASIRMVGKEGGFDHPLISYYFPNKKKLFETVVTEMIDEFNQSQDSLYEGLGTLSIAEGVSLFVDRIVSFNLKRPELFRTIMQNAVYVEKLEDIPGLQFLIDFLSGFMENIRKNFSVDASTDQISKVVYSFSVLLINYLGAESSYATVLGLGENSREYRMWVRDSLNLVFRPILKEILTSNN